MGKLRSLCSGHAGPCRSSHESGRVPYGDSISNDICIPDHFISLNTSHTGSFTLLFTPEKKDKPECNRRCLERPGHIWEHVCGPLHHYEIKQLSGKWEGCLVFLSTKTLIFTLIKYNRVHLVRGTIFTWEPNQVELFSHEDLILSLGKQSKSH